MSDPTVNIFEALRRMGAKIPFRFEMVDFLVPTVQMYDVSRLVSAPVEPRGLVGNTLNPGANQALLMELQSLASGGVFVEFMVLDAKLAILPAGGPGVWSIRRVSQTTAVTPLMKVDVGGAPTESLAFTRTAAWDFTELVGAALFPPSAVFPTSPRFFIPPASVLRVQSPRGQVGDTLTASYMWAELPASFEPT